VSLATSLNTFNALVLRYDPRHVLYPKTAKWAPIVRYIFARLEQNLGEAARDYCDFRVFFPGKETCNECRSASTQHMISNRFMHDNNLNCDKYHFLISQRISDTPDTYIEELALAVVQIFHEFAEHARLFQNSSSRSHIMYTTQQLQDAQKLQDKLTDVTYLIRHRRYTTDIWFKIPASVPSKLFRFLSAICDPNATELPTPEQRWSSPRSESEFAYPLAEYLARNVSDEEHRILLEALVAFKGTLVAFTGTRSRTARSAYATCDTLIKKICPQGASA